MPDLDSVPVVGRFGITAGDNVDIDDEPNIIWCDAGEITLEPLVAEAKVVGGSPVPWTGGQSELKPTVDAEGFLTWRGQHFMKVVDLTSTTVNPRIVTGKATHRVTFRGLKAGASSVTFTTREVRLAADTVEALSPTAAAAYGLPEGTPVCDLTRLLPVPVANSVPIVVGPRGTGISSMAVADGDLIVELSDGTTENAGALPIGPGGSDAGVAGYLDDEGSDVRAIFDPLVTANLQAAVTNPGPVRDEIEDVASVASGLGGYDVIPILGQSEASGRGTGPGGGPTAADAIIFQLKGKAPNKGTIIPATDPLDMVDTPTGIGPGLEFARRYVAAGLNRGRPVLLVPAAQGGTPAYRTATPTWNPTVSASLYANAQTQIATALAAGNDTTRVVAIIWCHGETDGDLNVTGPQYQSVLDPILAGLRTAADDPTVPILITGMVPEYLSTGTRAAINLVQATVPVRFARAAFVPTRYDVHLGDGNHSSAEGQVKKVDDLFPAFEAILAGSRYVPRVPGVSFAPYMANAPLLDEVGAPAFRAHSVKLLAAGYGGACIKAERSDGVTLDVGFYRGWINTEQLLRFSQGLDVRMRTYFDQSGNLRDFEQPTYANQAALVRAGRLVEHAGILMPTGDGVNTFYYDAGAGLFAAGAASVLAVIKAGLAGTVGGTSSGVLFAEASVSYAPVTYRLLAQSSAGAQLTQYGVKQDGTVILPATNHTGAVLPYSAFNGMVRQVTSIDTGSEVRKYLDGNLIGTVPVGDRTGAMPVDGQSIWGNARSATVVANRWSGAIPEIVAFPDDLSDAARLAGMQHQRQAFDAVWNAA